MRNKLMKKMMVTMTMIMMAFGMLLHPVKTYACTGYAYYDAYDEYLLPYSDCISLSYSDIEGMSAYWIQMAINEIYARHGYQFVSKDVKDYFESKSWYYGYIRGENFDESVFNKYENANISFLSKYSDTGAEYITYNSCSSISYDNSYIFYDSNSRYLCNSDVSGMSTYWIQMAINEIYARHGYQFVSKDVKSYFEGKSWYYGYLLEKDFDESVFNTYEESNIAFLGKYL